MLLLVLVPWVLTVIALIVIMVIKNRAADMEEEDYMDDDHEVIRVAVYDEKAYWVYKNVFYESEVTREPDFTTARPIDTMDLAPKELDKLMHILDELQEDTERE